MFNEVLLGSILFFLAYQHYVAQVDYRTERLSENENGILPIYSVGKQYQASDYTEVPKGVGYYALPLFFGRYPLQHETQRKAHLPHQPEDDPEAQDIKFHSSSHL
jgi:hypothetical protein